MILDFCIYYFQNDAVCFIILAFILLSDGFSKRRSSTEDKIFNYIIIALMFFCASDAGSWYFDGKTFPGARIILYLVNIIYISMCPIISILWLDQTFSKVEGKRLLETKIGKVSFAFLLILLTLLVSTPFTDFAFSLSPENVYTRSVGAYIGPAFTWIHLLGVTIWIIFHAKKGGKLIDKDLIIMVIKFIAPVFFATLLQLCFYGISTLNCGFLISVIMIYTDRQKNQISTDELTGLNNRRELNKYLERLGASGNIDACVCLIDIDRFKQINDKFGHLEGDDALKTVSEVLKKSCAEINDGWFLARFGGDEFVLAGTGMTEEDILIMKETIMKNLSDENEKSDKLYKIEISFGYGEGILSENVNLEDLMKKADDYMYAAKNRKAEENRNQA